MAAATATAIAMQAEMIGIAAPPLAAAGKPGTTGIVQDLRGVCGCSNQCIGPLRKLQSTWVARLVIAVCHHVDRCMES